MAEFRRLHQFLEKKEKLLLAQVEEVKKEIATIKNKRITTLSDELSTLESIIQEMEEKCQQEASEFLEVGLWQKQPRFFSGQDCLQTFCGSFSQTL